MKRATPSALSIHAYMQAHPLAALDQIQKGTQLGFATVNRIVPRLVQIGILRETTGHARNRVFVYDAYMKLLGQGAEPLRPGVRF